MPTWTWDAKKQAFDLTDPDKPKGPLWIFPCSIPLSRAEDGTLLWEGKPLSKKPTIVEWGW